LQDKGQTTAQFPTAVADFYPPPLPTSPPPLIASPFQSLANNSPTVTTSPPPLLDGITPPPPLLSSPPLSGSSLDNLYLGEEAFAATAAVAVPIGGDKSRTIGKDILDILTTVVELFLRHFSPTSFLKNRKSLVDFRADTLSKDDAQYAAASNIHSPAALKIQLRGCTYIY
jgi:hypothetical protein